MSNYPRTPQPSPLSPHSSRRSRRDSVTQEPTIQSQPSKMLKIHNLLNPETTHSYAETSASNSPTLTYTTVNSTPASTPRPDTPTTASSAKQSKRSKDAAIFARSTPLEPVNYKAFECSLESICLTTAQSKELVTQHERFSVFPNGQGDTGLIRDFARHIPYSSEKKAFYTNTGREAFEVFQYTFTVPGAHEAKTHTVMWDYQNGLVRITPFFKACGLSKIAPAKALGANKGLKELSYSITGGALAAQGYWVPYACARALCLTFAYSIRWVLTPVFGHSFINDCLRPEHPQYKSFKIDTDLVRDARLEAEGWKTMASRSATPNSPTILQKSRLMPPTSAPAEAKSLRPRKDKPEFKQGSPFSANGKSYVRNQGGAEVDSPILSPKTSPAAIPTLTSSGWASINRPFGVPRSPPNDSLVNGYFFSRPLNLINEPRSEPQQHQASWRDMNGSPAPSSNRVKMPTGAHDKYRTHKRPAKEVDEEYKDDNNMDISPSTSTSLCSEIDIVSSPPLPTAHLSAVRFEPLPKRVRRSPAAVNAISSASTASRSTKMSAEDGRAAQLLLDLHMGDSELARGPTVAEQEAGHRLYKGKGKARMV